MFTNDPEYQKFLETHPGTSYHDYNVYCAEKHNKWMQDQLQKHLDRNIEFLKKHKELEPAFIWVKEFMKNLPASSNRNELGDEIMNARLKTMAKYNTLMFEFARDGFDEETVILCLTGLQKQKEILEK